MGAKEKGIHKRTIIQEDLSDTRGPISIHEKKYLQYGKYSVPWAATTSVTRTRLTGAEPMQFELMKILTKIYHNS